MSIADSRVVGYYWTDACGKRVMEFTRKQPYSDAIPLVPFPLLAESESRVTLLQDSIAAMLAERNALQSRLDAVVGLADGLAQRGCDMQARVDQSFAEEAEHTYYHGYTNVISESADALRSAALGCATTGEGGE